MHSNIRGSLPAICPSLFQFDRSGGLPVSRQWGTVVASTAGLCTTLYCPSMEAGYPCLELDNHSGSLPIFIKSWSWHTNYTDKMSVAYDKDSVCGLPAKYSSHNTGSLRLSSALSLTVLCLLFNQNYRTGALSTEVENEGRRSREDPCHCFIPMTLQSGSSLTSMVSWDP